MMFGGVTTMRCKVWKCYQIVSSKTVNLTLLIVRGGQQVNFYFNFKKYRYFTSLLWMEWNLMVPQIEQIIRFFSISGYKLILDSLWSKVCSLHFRGHGRMVSMLGIDTWSNPSNHFESCKIWEISIACILERTLLEFSIFLREPCLQGLALAYSSHLSTMYSECWNGGMLECCVFIFLNNLIVNNLFFFKKLSFAYQSF